MDNDFVPTKWWRAVDAEGRLWCESSIEEEVRRSMRPGDVLQRAYKRTEYEWRDVAKDT